MNKEQFISLLRSPATINLNLVKELEEITQQFPYFQNAHMLLAKQYQGHENIRYESYLRKAAAYAPDRSVLYHLIKLEPSEVIHMQKEHAVKSEKEKKIVSTVATDEVKEIPKVEEPVPQPKVIFKEESHQKESLKEDIKEPKIPEISTAIDAPVKAKNTQEAPVPVMSSITETPEISKKASETKAPEINTITETPEISKKTSETKAPEIDTPVEVKIPVKNEEEPAIQEINTVTETPVISKKIKEPKVPEVDVPVVTEKKSEETLIPEIKTTSEVPVISNKTKEPDTSEIDSSINVSIIAEKAKETKGIEIKETRFDESEISPDSLIKARETKIESDPQEILAKRLEEIANPKTVTSKVSPATPEKNITETVQPTVPTEQKPIEVTTKPAEQIVSQPVVLPKEVVKPVSEHHSFLEWLRIKDIPVLAADRHHDYFKENQKSGEPLEDEASDPENNIIDNFIKTEPRIVPAKSEFYSPGNMARQSAMEHEDLISETLARIYAQQGNIPKAIDAYRRLSLKLPEKSSYFAALIKELEEREQD